MRVDSLRSLAGARVALVLATLTATSPLAAQTPDPGAGRSSEQGQNAGAPPVSGSAKASGSSAALALSCDVSTAGMDAGALRAAIESELSVPVRLASAVATQGTHLAISATSQAAVNLRFVRADGSTIERTVDISNAGLHTNETLALVAANLMRDEAADLLDALRAAQAPPPTAAVAAKPAPPPPPPMPKGCEPNNLRKVKLGLDVLPYVGMSSRDTTEVERKFSFNLFGGLTGAVRGFELGGFLNLDDHSVCGLQISGIANVVNGPVQGVQFGMINWSNGRVDGTQFGMVAGGLGSLKGVQFGLIEIAGGDVTGAQFGLVNVGGESLTGAQFGLGNLAGTSVTGGQFGLVNLGRDTLTGVQAGLANIAASDVTGAQLGLANLSGGTTTGLQLGLANVSVGPVRGAMIGLFNTAQDADAPIGLVNVLWKGRTHVDLWATDFGLFAVGIEHGGRYLHNIYGLGGTERKGHTVLSPVFGVGGRVVQAPRWTVDLDALSHWLFLDDAEQDEIDAAFIGTLRVPIAYRFTSEFAVFVSPALNVSWADTRDNMLSDPSLLGGEKLPRQSANWLMRIWPGFTLGVRFF